MQHFLTETRCVLYDVKPDTVSSSDSAGTVPVPSVPATAARPTTPGNIPAPPFHRLPSDSSATDLFYTILQICGHEPVEGLTARLALER
jgi:hypothetical protein